MDNGNPAPVNNLVYFLGHDASTLKDLGRRLKEQQLALAQFEHPAALAAAALDRLPAVLILELGMLPQNSDIAGFLTNLLGTAAPGPALICIAESDGIDARLRSVRAGAKAFFVAPPDPAQLAAKTLQAYDSGSHDPLRILIVEDDQAQAMYVAMLLTKAGMTARTLSEPLTILSVLAEFRPDLILMDLYMPQASGAELTAIIRDHDQFYDTPILMVSNETDADKQIAALLTGSDGFITKHVNSRHLIAFIEHRVRMARWLPERRAIIAKRGAPSRLLCKDLFIRTLERAVRDGTAGGAGSGVLIIELDSPQQFIDRLGLSGFEKLLAQVEQLIGRQLAGADVATRYGEFSYAVLTQRKDGAALVALGEKLRRITADSSLAPNLANVVTTASVGIGLFQPPPEDALTLLARAERACAKARQNGGARVEIWALQAGRSENRIKTLIETALKSEGFVLLFQPIVTLGHVQGTYFEAQLRLRSPDGDLLPPREFFPVAERHGLMTAIDRWVMEYALDTLRDHRIRHPDLRILVHQTMDTLRSREWLPWLREQLIRRDLKRIRPVLQFQVRDVRTSVEIAKVLFGVLRKGGMPICLGNVTNSPSEIALVGQLGVALVKLSINTLTQTNIHDLTALVEQLHDQKALVVATGIEDQQTVTQVWNCRADFIQGNYIQMARDDINVSLAA
ncbi:EAL domain-containing protein [uncultured Lamprocystis sp.]|jgi:diguanylate cyclase (GGDEF)-like protein|uniref:EAL domain-containing protein n=1 Tax=uncultured Lamprocystis sp. TaxID=543132 RepID=UPI0025FE498D|nr:EAL domain-containing response regulator [uncultured Lamprocystis sp.]